MKNSPCPTPTAVLAATLLLLFPAGAARAQTLPGGTYRATAELGAVLLDGRYPLLLGEVPGLLEVSTSPTGALTGEVVILDQRIEVTGQLVSRPGYNRIVLRSRVVTKHLLLKASLHGGQFVGKLQVDQWHTPCRFDVTVSAPIRADYVLALSTAAHGVISGSGTLFAARQQISLNVRGRIGRNGEGALTITGPKIFLKSAAVRIDGASVTAKKWTAQGFGALLKGVNLHFTADAP